MTPSRNGLRWILVACVLWGGAFWAPLGSRQSAASSVTHKQADVSRWRRERTPTFAALRERLQEQGGQLRVIVRLDAAYAPEADLSTARALEQRVALDRTARALKGELGSDVRSFESLQRLPIAILVVDDAGLDKLQRSARVLSIQEDAPEPMQLAESTDLIGASGSTGPHAAGYTGAGYAVAILDVGLDRSHPFLAGRVVIEACFSTSYAGSYSTTTLCPNGADEQVGEGAARPCNVGNLDPLNACDHGTHVAGIAAGHQYATMVSAGQATSLYDGVAPDADIVAVQVFSRMDTASQCGGVAFTPCYLTFPSDQLRALDWLGTVAQTVNLASINMSLGGTTKYTGDCDSDTRKVGIDSLRAAGVVTFVAAGNAGWTDGVSAPGCISSVVTVGSTRDGGPAATPADSISSFSNSSALVEMWAPGEWIQSSTLNDKFTLKAGSSMAAPHVAGAWLVFKQMYPTEDVDTLLNRMLSEGLSVTDARNGISKPRLRFLAPAMTPTPGTPTMTRTATATSTPTMASTTAPTLTPTATATPLSLWSGAVYLPLLSRVEALIATPTVPPVPSGTPGVGQAVLVIEQLSGDSMPEAVVIRNTSAFAQSMDGWSLVSVVGPQTFRFSDQAPGFVLAAGSTVSLESYTNAGNSPPAVLFWTSSAIWNNTGDKAELRDPNGQLVSSRCYDAGCP